ncbi:amino acid ABC transporter ATP-binding protein [Pseudomonas gingeri]|uniref:Amino acid ABC transporter ATP-binding protein n=2 Tax=Pseudomonas gingeri TaxID=117681 RepID=A0A7Y7Y4E0_9PSED|nr:amino acid ABC transporter ATP-binding protein [Pseudomonas gingeri]PNQ91315.1 amino acid ABC transporter ATP-binding protein [Pseudomonas gingeri NCPPB 3146 = LMG 5327]NVZ64247.1 amino acid ABC transporter ATP-binding protein [Pseudomonas gingeri]NVZ77269.1 amino acid ABC transporter ATP-binding protein [Pseudomonas gingeri]NWA02594.1 amino acid ABC transporter ATP-binding protein [Pseudomonas gingeri]
MPHLNVVNLSSAYAQIPVLQNVSLSVDRGEVISLIGPSGSGKSTLLRVLMGLLPPTAGRVLIDDEPLDYVSKSSLRAARDKMAIVFQQYNLFQNMDVLRNVTIAPTKIKKRPRAEVELEAKALLKKVGLGEKYHAYPDELSGGQQQRVAIARALALRPQILLLDEVTAALDPELVNEVLDTVRALAKEGITMLLVSHEMSFVREVSTRIVMMDKGQVVEIGTPQQIFEAPVEARTREFVGKILRH